MPPREIADEVVRHVDVPPTLAQIVDGDLSGQALPMHGRSLAPFLTGEVTSRSRTFAFAQRSQYAPTPHRRAKGNFEPGSRFSLQSLDFKYLMFTEGEDEFYDLRDDPYEKVNLIALPEHEDNIDRFRSVVQPLLRLQTQDQHEKRPLRPPTSSRRQSGRQCNSGSFGH